MQLNGRIGYMLATGAILITTASFCVDKDDDQRIAQSLQEIAIVRTYAPTSSPTPAYTLVPTQSPTPMPTPVYVSDSFRDLERQLDSKIREYESWGADFSVAVTDLQTGEIIAVDGDELHVPACVINQMALYTMVREFQEGRSNPEDMAYDITVGVQASSPGHMANALTYYFGSYEEGVRSVQQWMDDNEIFGTYNHVPDQSAVGEWTNNILTANSANEALSKLYRRELFNDQWTAYAINMMIYDNHLNYAIPAGVGDDAVVAHKIGWYPGIDGDSGIVMFPGKDGAEKAFAITIFSQEDFGVYFPSAARDITSVIYDHFRTKY